LSFGIVYQLAQFKGIATGGNVSLALALAGTFVATVRLRQTS
jgi:hypothetical protein